MQHSRDWRNSSPRSNRAKHSWVNWLRPSRIVRRPRSRATWDSLSAARCSPASKRHRLHSRWARWADLSGPTPVFISLSALVKLSNKFISAAWRVRPPYLYSEASSTFFLFLYYPALSSSTSYKGNTTDIHSNVSILMYESTLHDMYSMLEKLALCYCAWQRYSDGSRHTPRQDLYFVFDWMCASVKLFSGIRDSHLKKPKHTILTTCPDSLNIFELPKIVRRLWRTEVIL